MPTVYVAMETGLLTASGDDGDWEAAERLGNLGDDDRLECLAADARVPERLFCGTFAAGLHRSDDGGETWARVGEGAIESTSVLSLAVSTHDPAVVYAGTEPSAVYRSDDAGETWTPLADLTTLPSADEWYFPPRPDTHHVRWLEVDPHDPDRLYVGIEAGALVLTEDGGRTWRDRPDGARLDNHQLATHPDAPGRVYAAAGDGYAESTDGGQTWTFPQDGLDHRYVWSVAPAPDDPDTVLVSSARGAGRAHSPPGESYVYRRRGTDSGERTDGSRGSSDRGSDGGWQRLEAGGLPTGEGVLRPVLVPGDGEAELYAASNRGVFRTTDAGESWDRLPIDWPDRYGSMTCRGLAVV